MHESHQHGYNLTLQCIFFDTLYFHIYNHFHYCIIQNQALA